MTEPQDHSGLRPCPACREPVGAEQLFCEGCGFRVNPGAPSRTSPGEETPVGLSSRTTPTHPLGDEAGADGSAPTPPGRVARGTCGECGGVLDEERYCTTCGTRAPKARDHFVEQPAPWVAGCCDRGLRHTHNEDAMALAAEAPPASSAILVVCDGVSSSVGSDVAALAAARTTRDVLLLSHARGLGTAESAAAAMAGAMTTAVEAANQAVVSGGGESGAQSANSASCTFAAAMIADGVLVYGNVGDSRVYWVPDDAPTLLLTTDDSLAQVRIDAGIERSAAESGPGSHTITRWLGADATDIAPRTGGLELSAAGWVLVCSDGLWNYASAPEQVGELVHSLCGTEPPDPLWLSRRLVDWANEQGGRDNITAALARIPAVGAQVSGEGSP